MLKVFFASVALAAASVGPAAATTAYEALQVLRGTRGDTVMSNLVEVRGDAGQPQPQSWTITANDPTARGGVREFVVSAREILSERTPLRSAAAGGALAPIALARLNLDSDGAFKVAERQAVSKKLGFNSVNYTLRTNPATGAPVWALRLADYMGAPVGSVRISAEDGKTISGLSVDPDARQRPAAQQPAPQPPPASGPPPAQPAPEPGEREPMGGVLGAISQTARGFAGTVRDTSVNTAGTVEEWLTGRRTLGTDDGPSQPGPAPAP